MNPNPVRILVLYIRIVLVWRDMNAGDAESPYSLMYQVLFQLQKESVCPSKAPWKAQRLLCIMSHQSHRYHLWEHHVEYPSVDYPKNASCVPSSYRKADSQGLDTHSQGPMEVRQAQLPSVRALLAEFSDNIDIIKVEVAPSVQQLWRRSWRACVARWWKL